MGKGGIFLRYILFSLGSTLSKRVYPFLCDKDTVNCPSLQRLQSNVQQEDIILLRSEDANKKSVRKIIEKERSLVFFPDHEEPSGNNDHSIYLREYFSEYEIRKAIDRLSTSDYISSLLRNSLAGSSDIMEKTRRQIRKAIDSSIPVHIVGETGTGKTLAAKFDISAKEADYLMSVDTIQKDMYNVNDDRITILYKDNTLKDISEASEVMNISLLSKKIRKYYLCYQRF